MTQRFFAALLPPMAIQTEVIQIQNYFRDRYCTSKTSIKSPPHITLIAPFELSSDRLETLQIELKRFAQSRSPFTINLSGFAAFAPRIIYIDVLPNPFLQNLYVDLTVELANSLGVIDRYASRPFVPHMTVSSLNMNADFFNMAWTEFGDRQINFEFEVRKLTLLANEEQRWNNLSSFDFQEEKSI